MYRKMGGPGAVGYSGAAICQQGDRCGRRLWQTCDSASPASQKGTLAGVGWTLACC